MSAHRFPLRPQSFVKNTIQKMASIMASAILCLKLATILQQIRTSLAVNCSASAGRKRIFSDRACGSNLLRLRIRGGVPPSLTPVPFPDPVRSENMATVFTKVVRKAY